MPGTGVTGGTPGEGASDFDDHADAFALAQQRCSEAVRALAESRSRVARLSRFVRRTPVEAAVYALGDLVEHLATRHRHDIEYLNERLAAAERRALVFDDLARRVELSENSTNDAVADLARFGAWFANADLVLWLGHAAGPLHDSIAGAGPVMVYGGSATAEQQEVDAAVVSGRPVTSAVIAQVVDVIAPEGLFAIEIGAPTDVPAVVEEVSRAGFATPRLTWVVDELHTVAGSMVVTFRRRP
jgi:hypothetical protein